MNNTLIKLSFVLMLIIYSGCSAQTQDAKENDAISKAQELLDNGHDNFDEIIDILSKELAENPDNENARKFLGYAYYRKQDYKKANKEFSVVINSVFMDDAALVFLYIKSFAYMNEFKMAWQTDSRYWAFISQDGNAEMYEQTVSKISSLEREYLCQYSRQIIFSKYADMPENSMFIEVDAANLSVIEKDSDTSRLLVRDSTSGFWSTVEIIPTEPDGKFGYAVYFQDYIPIATVKFDYQKFRKNEISKIQLKANMESITPAKYIKQLDGYYFEPVQLSSDKGEPIIALRLMKF